MRLSGTVLVTLGCLLLAPLPASARDVPWERVPGGAGLSRAEQARAERLMNAITVYYGCSDTIAACLATQPTCETARRAAGLVVRVVKAGRSDDEAKEAVKLRGLSVHPFKVHRFNLVKRPRHGAPEARAKVTIVEFADFECPFCRVVSPILKRITAELAGRGVSLVFKHYPVGTHDRAESSARAAWAAHQQDRFWAYHDLLYQKAPRLKDGELQAYARTVGLDAARFQSDRTSSRAAEVVAVDKREGLRAGLQGTPGIYVNGKLYRGRKDYVELRDRVEEELFLVEGRK